MCSYLAVFSPGEDAAGVERWTAEALDRINSVDDPFNETWHEWLPDPAWPTPMLPASWKIRLGRFRPWSLTPCRYHAFTRVIHCAD
jgi:hypothetical protein